VVYIALTVAGLLRAGVSRKLCTYLIKTMSRQEMWCTFLPCVDYYQTDLYASSGVYQQ
jgi:hypothetical protein